VYNYLISGLLALLLFAVNESAAAEENAAPDPLAESDTVGEVSGGEQPNAVEEIEDVEDMQVAAVAGGFLVQSPSGKRGLTEWTRYEGPLMTLNLGLMAIVDYNTFDQDAASEAQVGDIPSESELRAGRLMLRGKLGRNRSWSYFYAGEYNGLSREPEDNTFRTTDLALTRSLGRLGDLTVGKTKEPIHLARIMPGDGVLLMERATMDGLIPNRGTGIKLDNYALDRRVTWSIGWFNDWLFTDESFSESDNIYTGRITGLPVYADEGHRLIHLGLAVRYAEAENGTFRFREPPEANTAPRYLDTGEFPAKKSKTLNLELGTVNGGLSFQAEYLKTYVSSAQTGDPEFTGWYLAGSWILTGESRSYFRRGGFFFKVAPDQPLGGKGGGHGAWELTFRVSNTDLNDSAITGGEFSRWSIGANWYATERWRLEVNYGQGKLDRFGIIGDTEFLQFRLQWLM
jgi:phosphate-selective porin